MSGFDVKKAIENIPIERKELHYSLLQLLERIPETFDFGKIFFNTPFHPCLRVD